MTKYFCDGCGEEITARNQLQFVPIGKASITIEPRVVYHDFCKYCVIDAFNKLDDRPKAIPLTDDDMKKLQQEPAKQWH